MNTPDSLRSLCLDDKGQPRPKNDCRATIINHLILEESLDIDEAEDLAELTLKQSGFWPDIKTTEDDPEALQ